MNVARAANALKNVIRMNPRTGFFPPPRVPTAAERANLLHRRNEINSARVVKEWSPSEMDGVKEALKEAKQSREEFSPY